MATKKQPVSLAQLKAAFDQLDPAVKAQLLGQEEPEAPTLEEFVPPTVTAYPDVYVGKPRGSAEEKRLAIVDIVDVNAPNSRTNLRFFGTHGLDIVLAMMKSAMDDGAKYTALLDLRNALSVAVEKQQAGEKRGKAPKRKAPPSKSKAGVITFG